MVLHQPRRARRFLAAALTAVALVASSTPGAEANDVAAPAPPATPTPAGTAEDLRPVLSADGVSAQTLSLCGLVYVSVVPLSPNSAAFLAHLPMTVTVRDPGRNLAPQQVTVFDIGTPSLSGTTSPVLFPADTTGRGPGTVVDLTWNGGSQSLQTEPYTDNCLGSFEPRPPVRVLDTRTGTGRPGIGKVTRFQPIEVDLNGFLPRPDDAATAAVLNVTVTNPEDAGFVAVYPCGGSLPSSSSVNFAPRETAPNLVVVDLVGRRPAGKVCMFSSANADLIADLTGVFVDHYPPWTVVAPSTSFTALPSPQRLLDTRTGDPVGAGASVRVPTRGRGGIPASSVRAVSLNLTATDPATEGYLTVYPCDSPVPNASNLNVRAGQTRPNAAIVQVGPDQDVCVFSSTQSHVIVDVMGYYSSDTTTGQWYWPHAPTRLFDSRSMTIPGHSGPGKLTGGTALVYPSVFNRAGEVVSLNITATAGDADGWLSVYPCSSGVPATSNLNFAAGQTIANAVTVRVDDTRAFCVFASATVHVIIDQSGYHRAR